MSPKPPPSPPLTITSEGAAALEEDTAQRPHSTLERADEGTKSTHTVVSVEAALRRARHQAALPIPSESFSSTAQA